MILFFDTETTGFPDMNARARAPHQPHIVQLAAILEDGSAVQADAYNVIIKPDGWTIPAEAAAVHGITTERALAVGIPEREAAAKLLTMIRAAELVVAHNITFDKFIALIAMRRFDLITDADDAWWKGLNTRCTMRELTPFCKLPNMNGYSSYKWPKLQEAHKHCFGTEFDGAHDALADVRACAKLFYWLRAKETAVKV